MSLNECHWYRVNCRFCHAVNMAVVDQLPHKTGTVPCPNCGTNAKFAHVGKGRTTYTLPFHERVKLVAGQDYGRIQ